MEGESGSRGLRKINRKVLRNAQKLFEVLHEESILPQDKFQQVSALLNGDDIDVNVPDKYDRSNTLLHGAVNYDFVDVVKLLLENDAEVNIRNAEGETPLHIAVVNGFVKIVQMLLEKGADVNIKNAEGETPLHIAVAYSSVNIALMILKDKKCDVREQKLDFDVPKVDVNIQNEKGETPLHLVFSERRINKNKFGKPIVQMLLKCKADVNIQNSDGKTALDLAKETKNQYIIDTFESKKNISSQDEANHCQDDKIRRADTNKVEANDNNCPVQPVTDAFVSSPKTYASSGAKKSMHGTIYQLCLLMLFAIRAIVMRYRFHLGTEVDEAEQFDDLVFKYQCPNTTKLKSLFLQAKSKSKAAKGIGLDELLEEGNKAQFSLLKYYKSYVKIRNSKGEEADEIVFSICTNTHFNFSEPGVLIGNGKKLSFKIVTDTFGEFLKEGICYKLHMDEESFDWLKNDFEEKLKREIISLKGKDSKELNAILSNLNDTYKTECGSFRYFLKNVVFVVGQTANIELVKTEFRNYSKTNCVDTDLLTDAFYKQMFDWFSKKEGEWLPNDKVEEMIGTICEKVNTFASSISQVYAEKLLTSPIKFNIGALEKLQQRISVNRIVKLITPVKTKLTLLQVAQVLEHYPSYKAQDRYIFVHFSSLLLSESQERIIRAFESPRNNDLLVIDCLSNDVVILADLTKLRDKLWEITANNDRKKLILIAPEKHALAEMFISHHGYYTQNVKHIFEDFKKETQDMLLSTQVTFQGQRMKLSQVIDETDKELLEIVPLESLIGDEGLVIGTEIPISTGYNESYYIDRFVRYQTVVKADIFDDNSNDNFNDELATTELEFQQLCAIHPKNNIHLIETHGDRSIWVKSQGKLSALRPYIDNDNTQACSEELFVDSVKLQRVVIISDSAGMGKSTVLDHISKKIKTKYLGTLVLRIDLNRHTKVLKMHKQIVFNNTSAKEFIYELFKMTTPLERSFLEQNRKAVLMFDGFDEISPDYKEVVLDLIHNLKDGTKAQIWITTRPFMREELENNLHQFSYTLQPFSTKNQEDFLINYWKHMKGFEDTDENKIRAFALTLVEQLSKSISDKEREFTGIPLQMRMLAECFVEDFEKPVDFKNGFTLVDLYEKFARLKFDVFLREKYGIEESLVGSRQSEAFNMYMKLHRWYALSETFSEEKVDILFPNSKKVTGLDEIESDLNRIGIVSITNGVPHFIHRTFAEYIVAVYCMKLLKSIDSLKPELKDFIISDLLISVNFSIVRSFLNGLFSSKISAGADSRLLENPTNSFSRDFITNKTKFIEKIFLQTAKEGNRHFFVYIFHCVQTQQDTLRKFLQCTESISNKTMLHLAAENDDTRFVEKFLNWTRDNVELGREVVKGILQAANNDGQTALLLASRLGYKDVVQMLLHWTLANMDQGQELVSQMLLTEDTEGLTTLMLASRLPSDDLVQTLMHWTHVNMDQGQELVKQMLISANKIGYTTLMVASRKGNSDVVRKLLQWTRDNMDQGQELVKLMLQSTEYIGSSPLLVSSVFGKNNVVMTLLQWTRDNIDQSQDIIKQMVLSTDVQNYSPLLLASRQGHNEVVQTLLQLTRGNTDQGQDVVVQMLRSEDYKGSTALLLASGFGNNDVVQTLLQWTYANIVQGQDVVKQMLLYANNEGYTALIVASWQIKNDVVKTILQWTSDNMNQGQELVTQMLRTVDNNGETALDKAAARKNGYDVVRTLLQWTPDNTGQDQGPCWPGLDQEKRPLKQILLSDVSDVSTDLISGILEGNSDVVQTFLQAARDNNMDQGQEVVKQMVLSEGDIGTTVLQAASILGNIDMVKTLLQWTLDNLDKGQDVVKQMVLSTNSEGNTVLLVAILQGNNDVIQTLLQWTRDNMCHGQEIVKQMLLSTNLVGDTALLAASRYGKNDVVHTLLEWTRDKMEQGRELVMLMLFSPDTNSDTALHVASCTGNNYVVQTLLQWTRDKMEQGQDLVILMLFSPDTNSDTVLQVASFNGNNDVVHTLLQWTHDNMDIGLVLVKEMLVTANCGEGRTALQAAAFRGHNDVVKTLLQWTRDNIERDQALVKEMLLDTNYEGFTALLAASFNGHNNVVQTLLQWTRNNLDQGQQIVTLMILSQECRGSTALVVASVLGKIDVMQTLLHWTRHNLDQGQDVVKEMILSANHDGNTALLAASRMGHNDVVHMLLQWTRDNMDQWQDIVKRMLLASNNEAHLALLFAAGFGKKDVVQTLLQWTRDNMDQGQDIVKQMLLSPNNEGFTPLLLASWQLKKDVVQTLLQWTSDNMDQGHELLKEMLLLADNDGDTALHKAFIEISNYDVVSTLTQWIRDNMGEETLIELLSVRNNKGCTALEMRQ